MCVCVYIHAWKASFELSNYLRRAFTRYLKERSVKKNIWEKVLISLGSLLAALTHRITFLAKFTDQAMFKQSSTGTVLFTKS